jgi:hypothetical protein
MPACPAPSTADTRGELSSFAAAPEVLPVSSSLSSVGVRTELVALSSELLDDPLPSTLAMSDMDGKAKANVKLTTGGK